jgi:hypothetical protein
MIVSREASITLRSAQHRAEFFDDSEELARVVDRALRLRVHGGSGRLMRMAVSVPTLVTLSESVFAPRRGPSLGNLPCQPGCLLVTRKAI